MRNTGWSQREEYNLGSGGVRGAASARWRQQGSGGSWPRAEETEAFVGSVGGGSGGLCGGLRAASAVAWAVASAVAWAVASAGASAGMGSGVGSGGGVCTRCDVGTGAGLVASPRTSAWPAARAVALARVVARWHGWAATEAHHRLGRRRLERVESRKTRRGRRGEGGEAREARRWKRGGGSEATGAMPAQAKMAKSADFLPVLSGLIARWNTNHRVRGGAQGSISSPKCLQMGRWDRILA